MERASIYFSSLAWRLEFKIKDNLKKQPDNTFLTKFISSSEPFSISSKGIFKNAGLP